MKYFLPNKKVTENTGNPNYTAQSRPSRRSRCGPLQAGRPGLVSVRMRPPHAGTLTGGKTPMNTYLGLNTVHFKNMTRELSDAI